LLVRLHLFGRLVYSSELLASTSADAEVVSRVVAKAEPAELYHSRNRNRNRSRLAYCSRESRQDKKSANLMLAALASHVIA